MIQSVQSWLASQPGLEGLRVDALSHMPGSWGLFCQGQEVLQLRRDILGGTLRRLRTRFRLACHLAADGPVPDFSHLARQALPTAPILGREQTVAFEKGRLTAAGAAGIRRYEVEITFEYTVEV